jgi:hypothetical protein
MVDGMMLTYFDGRDPPYIGRKVHLKFDVVPGSIRGQLTLALFHMKRMFLPDWRKSLR